MARGCIKLQEELHNRILKLRSIESMVNRPQFERLWDDSSQKQKSRLHTLISCAARDGVRHWIRNHPSLDLMEKKLCDLQRIAYRLGIKNYSRKGKLQLVEDIRMNEEKYGTHQSIPA